MKYLEDNYTDESFNIISELKSEMERIQENLKIAEIKKMESEHFWNQYISDRQSEEYNRALEEYRRMREELDKDNEKQKNSESV